MHHGTTETVDLRTMHAERDDESWPPVIVSAPGQYVERPWASAYCGLVGDDGE